jgi:ATP-dependent Zn protease
MNDIPPEKKNIVDKTPQWLRLLLFVRLSIVISLGYTSYMAGTPVGFSRAQLKNLGQRSHGACGPKKKPVEMQNLHESRDKIILGLKRGDRLTDKEKKRIGLPKN